MKDNAIDRDDPNVARDTKSRMVEKILDDSTCYRREFSCATHRLLDSLSINDQVAILQNKKHVVYDDVKKAEYRDKVFPKIYKLVGKVFTITFGDVNNDLNILIKLSEMTEEEILKEVGKNISKENII